MSEITANEIEKICNDIEQQTSAKTDPYENLHRPPLVIDPKIKSWFVPPNFIKQSEPLYEGMLSREIEEKELEDLADEAYETPRTFQAKPDPDMGYSSTDSEKLSTVQENANVILEEILFSNSEQARKLVGNDSEITQDQLNDTSEKIHVKKEPMSETEAKMKQILHDIPSLPPVTKRKSKRKRKRKRNMHKNDRRKNACIAQPPIHCRWTIRCQHCQELFNAKPTPKNSWYVVNHACQGKKRRQFVVGRKAKSCPGGHEGGCVVKCPYFDLPVPKRKKKKKSRACSVN